MSSRIEKWAFGLTFVMFFLTAVAVLVAVGYASVHLVRETPTKTDLHELETKLEMQMQLMETRIISAVRKEFQSHKDNTNQTMINHVSDLHAVSKP